jgi:hypothetical protein
MSTWMVAALGIVAGSGALVLLLCLMSKLSGAGWLGYWRDLLQGRWTS